MSAAVHRHDVATAPDTEIQTVAVNDVARVDSRLLAANMGKTHVSLFELVKDHRADFEQLGLIRFQTGEILGRGRPEQYTMLTEDQAYLLLTYTRNTVRTRQLKIKLVKAFGEARRIARVHSTEYLPDYHALHNQIHALASGSPNEHFVHANVNRLINKAVGIEAGQRTVLKSAPLSLLTVTQAIAAKAFEGAKDHHEGYERAKQALTSFAAMIEVTA